MSKKNRKRSPEIPQAGNALEIPNYVVPMTDLEYKQVSEETARQDEASAHDCKDCKE
ncbi:MAG: hypothetical protein IJK24_01800 [Oscillospiraceae bacterium]|jgi:hypothetical protein|nr:hypothetical protein [Oscillospiraceae bacterium]